MTEDKIKHYEMLAKLVNEEYAGSPPIILALIFPEFLETDLIYTVKDTDVYRFGLDDVIRDSIFDQFDRGESILLVIETDDNTFSVISLGIL